MKKRVKSRLLALAMTMAMVLTMIPGAMAAETASSAISSANRKNNFDYSYGSVLKVDAGEEGAVFTETFDRPNKAKSGALYAAIVPTDAKGYSTGEEVRYVRLSDSGKLTYFRTGHRYFAVQLVQPLPDAGHGKLTVTKDGEKLVCRATMDMSQAMAQLVDLRKNRSEINRITYVCHLRCSSDEVEFDPATMELNSDIFDVSVKGIKRAEDGYGYDITCELQADWKKVSGRTTLVDKLMKTMSLKAVATLSEETEAELLADGEDTIYATGWISVEKVPVQALQSTQFQVPMVTSALELDQQTAGSGVADPGVTGVSDWLETQDHLAFMSGYTDGSFGPNRPITRAEAAQIFYNLLLDKDVPITVSFDDVTQDKWYYTAVNTLASLNILTGVGGGKFAPDRSITRAEFATIAAKFAVAVDGQSGFVDVPTSHWAYPFITTAANYGWVSGVDVDRIKFEPQRNITRAEAATLVNKMLGRSPDLEALQAGEGRQFTDVTQAHWAWSQIGEAATPHTYSKSGGAEVWGA